MNSTDTSITVNPTIYTIINMLKVIESIPIRRADEVDKKAEKLKSQGHTCIRYLESHPQILWCQQDRCSNS